MENFSIFAVSKGKTILLVIVCVAIFVAINTALYAAEYRLSIFNGCCAAKPVIVLPETKKDSLSSFTYFNFSFMGKTMKIEGMAKHSNRTFRQTEPNTVSREAFNIEMNAKNQAYHFILSHGLFDSFADFCRNVKAKDHHAACLSILLTQTMKG